MRKAILLITAIFLTACSNYPASLPSIKPYKMDIQQGNVVTPKMMMQLRPGMTKAQVRFIMGTPLIADSFHANRWDYFYQMRKDGKIFEQRRVILEFEDEKLHLVRGDVVAAGSNTTAADQPTNKAPITLKSASDPAPKSKEKGLIDKLKFWKSDDEQVPAKSEAKPEPQPAEIKQPAAEKLEALPPLMETPAVVPEKVVPEPVAKPEPMIKPEPKPEAQVAPVQKPEEKGLLDKLKFWKSDESKDAPKPETKPAPKVEPTSEIRKPETKPEPRPEPKPEQKVEPKAVPKPQQDLPTEEDPGYFEKMLEKIGF